MCFLTAQTQSVYSLLDQRLDRMLDPIGNPPVGEALAQTTQDPSLVLHLSQEDAVGVGSSLAAIEPAHDDPSAQTLKKQLCCGRLCMHKAAFPLLFNVLIIQHL